MNDPRREAQPLFLRPLGQVYSGYKTADLQAEASSLYLDRMIFRFDRAQPDAERLVKSVVAEVSPNIPVIRVLPYPDVVAGNFNQERLLARLTEAFGMLALILASVGLDGVMSYLGARRTSEIGFVWPGSSPLRNRFANAAQCIPAGSCGPCHRSAGQPGSRANDEAPALSGERRRSRSLRALLPCSARACQLPR